jgi:hypothetical protein
MSCAIKEGTGTLRTEAVQLLLLFFFNPLALQGGWWWRGYPEAPSSGCSTWGATTPRGGGVIKPKSLKATTKEGCCGLWVMSANSPPARAPDVPLLTSDWEVGVCEKARLPHSRCKKAVGARRGGKMTPPPAYCPPWGAPGYGARLGGGGS